ncbi:MAG: tRNA 2-thiouridine(34) synthase MnmA [Patescibacteria group bacterium]
MFKNKTIAIAMSGGVDSSVVAYLLKKQGYNLIGVFMHLWHDPDLEASENACCSLASRNDAKRIADKLNIRLYTLNFDKDFKKEIVNNFIDEYKKGNTPNPCIICNQKIKFDLLLKKVKALGADYLATGHYVKLIEKKKQFKLYKSKDKNKDQSYFLYKLKPDQLKSLMFPLADYEKKKVYKIAQQKDLLPKHNKESQDVCFIPKNDLAGFLKKYITHNTFKPGNIIDINNQKILGKHQGLAVYTYGQRSGIGVGGKGPYYVCKKDHNKNILFVTNIKDDKVLHSQEIVIKKINWISGHESNFPLKCKAKCRYGQKDQNVIIENNKVKFSKPQRAVTPGQSIVFYKRRELLGGGIISKKFQMLNRIKV